MDVVVDLLDQAGQSAAAQAVGLTEELAASFSGGAIFWEQYLCRSICHCWAVTATSSPLPLVRLGRGLRGPSDGGLAYSCHTTVHAAAAALVVAAAAAANAGCFALPAHKLTVASGHIPPLALQPFTR